MQRGQWTDLCDDGVAASGLDVVCDLAWRRIVDGLPACMSHRREKERGQPGDSGDRQPRYGRRQLASSSAHRGRLRRMIAPIKLSTLACSSLHAPLPLLVLAPALASPFVAAMLRGALPVALAGSCLVDCTESCSWPRAGVCGCTAEWAVKVFAAFNTSVLLLFQTGLERLQKTGTAATAQMGPAERSDRGRPTQNPAERQLGLGRQRHSKATMASTDDTCSTYICYSQEQPDNVCRTMTSLVETPSIDTFMRFGD